MDFLDEIGHDPETGAKRLVEEYGDRLFAVARRLGLNMQDSEDLVFRTLNRALDKIGSFNGNSSFFTWLYAIMMNFRRMDARLRASNALMPVAEVPERIDERPDPGETLAQLSDAVTVRAAVDGLPDIYREVVVFRYFEDLSMNDIAQILGIPAGTARFRLFQAKRMLRERLRQTVERDQASKTSGKRS